MDSRLKEIFHRVYEAEVKAALRLKIFVKKGDKKIFLK
jgi:hypothetical protein